MNELTVLIISAASIGFFHTLVGPDHYVPFIVMAKARRWSIHKTVLITLLCGVGHVLSSVVLGFIGILLGIVVFRLEAIESVRGEIAAWLLLGFGFTYFIWGLHRAFRKKTHCHFHSHADTVSHEHAHQHVADHAHPHTDSPASITPWVLFTIFVFGPCEPLIPLLMYPAAQGSVAQAAIVAAIFAAATIGTMLVIVTASVFSLSTLHFGRLERFSHALAGLTIALCGGAIKFLGL
jgi:sulfite exporter TauE/SafE